MRNLLLLSILLASEPAITQQVISTQQLLEKTIAENIGDNPRAIPKKYKEIGVTYPKHDAIQSIQKNDLRYLITIDSLNMVPVPTEIFVSCPDTKVLFKKFDLLVNSTNTVTSDKLQELQETATEYASQYNLQIYYERLKIGKDHCEP